MKTHPFTLSLLKIYYSRRSAMEQAFKAYKVKDDLNSTGIIEEDAHTWADLQAVPHPEDKYLAERIYRVGSTIVGIHISDQVDSIIGSSTQVFVACDCIRMILKMAAVSSSPYYKSSKRWT